MSTRSVLFSLPALVLLILAACAPMAPATAIAPTEEHYVVVPEQPSAKFGEGESAPSMSDVSQVPAPTMAPAFEIVNPSGELTVVERSNRMVVKNADLRLLVKDTDVAIDRALQIVGDAGGYIVSSRVWYQDYYGNNLKYASLTMGVPVDEFEHVLTRLRGLAIRVVDETASGDDVTEQYVDLQSQLQNLEATRARIQEFLKDAKTVDEALRINQELANIEAQIEQIKGRMNYLADRSAFSTITVNLEPEFPILTPTPTSTPKPTATPIPWNPGETYQEAQDTLAIVYQGIADFLIWLFVVVLPVFLPPALILWGLWKLLNRKPKVGNQ
ncbi:MAG TPA: DUF4349 domain-containing protein [Anaerolineales bacterium]|nr:DUF4349 domain-containing protein [Anaerolineales bacterium]